MGKLESKVKDVEFLAWCNKAELMYNNIKIGGLVQEEGEDPVLVVESFLLDIMGIEIVDGDILQASRMKGTLRRKVRGKYVYMHPLMFVKCSAMLRKMIEDSKGMLKKKRSPAPQFKFTIKNHLPEAHYAARLKWNEYIKDLIERNKTRPEKEKFTFYFRGEFLYVNKKKVVELVEVPTMEEILNVSDADRMAISILNFEKSSEKEQEGSVFQAFVLPVSTVQMIKNAYLCLKVRFNKATHISMGYVLELDGEMVTGTQHDGEIQQDVKISEALHQENIANIAVFVVRWYGGTHIGGARLTIGHQLAKEVLGKFPHLKKVDVPTGVVASDVETGEDDQLNDSEAGDSDSAQEEDEDRDSEGSNIQSEDDPDQTQLKQRRQVRSKKPNQGRATGGTGYARGRGRGHKMAVKS